MITRRCSQRQFLLRPSPVVEQVFLYCLGRAAETFGVQVHAFIVLSNHYHLVVTDAAEEPQLPAFMHWLNLHVAKALNVHYQRGENFWSPRAYSAVHLGDEEAVLEKIVYTLTNAVTAGLVEKPQDWPGLCSHAGLLARQSYSAMRPRLFFRETSDLPGKSRFRLTKPPALTYLSDARYQQLAARAVKARVEEIRSKGVQWSWGKALGRAAILAQNPFDRPGRRMPDRGLTPRVACKEKWLRIELLTALKEFRESYRDAWASWRSGDRSAMFPHGTYWMRLAHQVRITGPPFVGKA